MFISALFVIVRTSKQSKCLSPEEWIKKMWYIYTLDYYSAVINEVTKKYEGKWVEL